MSDHGDERRRTAPALPSRRVRASSRIALTAAAAVLSLVAAACGSSVAGVAAGGAVADPTAPSTGSSSSTEGAPSTGSTTEPPTSETATSETATSETGTSETGTSETGTSEDPSSTADPSSSSGADDAKLYPTEPIPYATTPNTIGIASLLEGRRLAGYVLDPGQIDPRLTDFVPIPTFPLRDSDSLGAIFPDEAVKLVARRQGMYTGYSATRGDPAGKASMVLAVFVFPSAAAAQKAAVGMGNASKDDTDAVVKIPGVADAVANQGPAGTTDFSGQAFLASGQSVVYVYVNSGVSQKATVPQRMRVALIQQVAALKQYTPLPKSSLMSQKFDPTGLYARTLPPAKNLTPYGVYSRQGALHNQTDALASLKLFNSAGVDVVVAGRAFLYRAKDAAGAAAVRDAFYAQEVANNSRYRDFDPGTSAGSPRCLQDSVQSQYVCYATVDRVAIEYGSDSESDLKRSLDAQVALLGK